MRSDQFKPKSYLKLNKKYVFSEGEQFPLSDFINANFSSGLPPGTQTKTDSFNPEKAEETQWNGLSEMFSQIWPQFLGVRGQTLLGYL